MLTDLEIEKARQLIANFITVANYEFSQKNSDFPKDRIRVVPEQVKLEPRIDAELLEFNYASWSSYVSSNADRMKKISAYMGRDNMTIECDAVCDGLVYLIANQKHAMKKGGE